MLIILFTYFYTAITINPTQMAEDMKRNNGFIPGLNRVNILKTILIPLWTVLLYLVLFLAFVAIMPAFAEYLRCKYGILPFFGGTSC